MKTLLQINASLNSVRGQSSRLSNQFVDSWQRANPDGQVISRDLAVSEIPHLTAERFEAFGTAPAERTGNQAEIVTESDELIAELESADIIVMGLPMYNFGIPSTLKAWIDHVARAGKTFEYTESGPLGLLADRPVVIFAARGGLYKDTPRDTQSAYITHFLNFIGIRDIEFVYAEGLNLGEDVRQESLELATQTIGRKAA